MSKVICCHPQSAKPERHFFMVCKLLFLQRQSSEALYFYDASHLCMVVVKFQNCYREMCSVVWSFLLSLSYEFYWLCISSCQIVLLQYTKEYQLFVKWVSVESYFLNPDMCSVLPSFPLAFVSNVMADCFLYSNRPQPQTNIFNYFIFLAFQVSISLACF